MLAPDSSKTLNSADKLLSALGIFALAVGVAIYALLRSTDLIVFGWIDALGWSDTVNTLRRITGGEHNGFPSWLSFALPDGLWSFSLAIALCLVWSELAPRIRLSLCLLAGAIGAGIEVCQSVGWIPGDGNRVDGAFHIAGGASAGLVDVLLRTHGSDRERGAQK